MSILHFELTIKFINRNQFVNMIRVFSTINRMFK